MRYRRLKHSLQHWVEVPQWAACKRKHAPHQRLRKKTSSTEKEKGEIGKSGKVWEDKDDRLVKITFGDDTADDPAPAPPDFLLLLLTATAFFELFFSSVSLSLSRDSLDSTLSTLELRVLRGTLELSFDKFDFFAGGFFELGGTFTGCWWLVLLPFTWKRFRWLFCGHIHAFLFWIDLPWTSWARELAETS